VFPTDNALEVLDELFGDRDLARSAGRILRDCPPEIGLIAEILLRKMISMKVSRTNETEGGEMSR
jgi:hypothetical protein